MIENIQSRIAKAKKAKIEQAILETKSGKYALSKIFNLLVDEIEKMVYDGFSLMSQKEILEEALDIKIPYQSYRSWYNRNFKNQKKGVKYVEVEVEKNELKNEPLKSKGTSSLSNNSKNHSEKQLKSEESQKLQAHKFKHNPQANPEDVF